MTLLTSGYFGANKETEKGDNKGCVSGVFSGKHKGTHKHTTGAWECPDNILGFFFFASARACWGHLYLAGSKLDPR